MGFVDGPRRVFINRIATSGRHIGSQGCHIAPHRHVPPGKLQGCHPSGATSRTRLTSRVTCPAAAVMLRLKQGYKCPCASQLPAAERPEIVAPNVEDKLVRLRSRRAGGMRILLG